MDPNRCAETDVLILTMTQTAGASGRDMALREQTRAVKLTEPERDGGSTLKLDRIYVHTDVDVPESIKVPPASSSKAEQTNRSYCTYH